jgi:hypothetical protein
MVCVEDGCRRGNLDLMAYLLALLLLRAKYARSEACQIMESVDSSKSIIREMAETLSSRINKTNLHGGSKQSIAFNQNISAAVQ